MKKLDYWGDEVALFMIICTYTTVYVFNNNRHFILFLDINLMKYVESSKDEEVVELNGIPNRTHYKWIIISEWNPTQNIYLLCFSFRY